MAIEIANALVAAGNFNPPNTPFTSASPILSGAGIQPFDPASNPTAPTGGFTYEAIGTYVIKMTEAMDFLEGAAFVQPQLPVNDHIAATAYIEPVLTGNVPVYASIDDYKTILVSLDANTEEGQIDAMFTLYVFRFATGYKAKDVLS
jgi:hypothetical protein